MTALLLAEDPALAVRDTPNGRLLFLLLLGVEDALRQRAMSEGSDLVLAELRGRDPQLVTRLPGVSDSTEK